MATDYEVKRQLARYWREEGNPRLKGLFAAALPNSDMNAEQVAEAWPGKKERMRHLQQSGRPEGMARALAEQSYAPGQHHADFEGRPEAGVARTLARDEFGSDDDVHRFLAGQKSMDKDAYVKRALLNDSPTELDTLFREELVQSLIMGAQPRKLFREGAANVRTVNRQKGDIPRESDEPYAEVGGYQSETPTGSQGFDTVPYDTVKIKEGFEIADELMAQSDPDAFESLARGVGAAVENTLNRIALVTLIDNAGESFDADVGGTKDATAVQALNGAATNVDLNNYGEADTAVVHPEFEQAIFEDTNVVYANRSGETGPIQDRQMGSIMGMDRFKASTGSYNNAGDTLTLSPSNTFGYTADGEIGAVAYRRQLFNVIVWDEFDMTTKSYEDPIRDLSGQNVRTWMTAKYGQTGAASTITY